MQRDQWFTGFYCRISFHGCLFSSTYASSVYAFLCWIGNRLNDEPRSSIHDVLHKSKRTRRFARFPGFFSIGSFSAPNLHDLAGWIETGAIFITILLLSKIYSIGTKQSSLQTKNSNLQNLLIPVPSAFAIFTILFLSATVFASNAHYQAKEKDMIPLPKIVVSLDNEELFTQKQDIPRQVTAQLHYEKAKSIQWQDRFRTIPHPYGLDPLINPNDQHWQAFEATWNSGGACTAVLSTHSPDSCIPLTGLIQINPIPGDAPETIKIRVASREIFF